MSALDQSRLGDVMIMGAGLLLNVLLTIIRLSARKRLRHFDLIVLAMSIHDALFSIDELLCLRTIGIRGRFIYIFSSGIDVQLPIYGQYAALFAYTVLIWNTGAMVPLLYYLRYRIMHSPTLDRREMVATLLVCLMPSLAGAMLSIVGVHLSMRESAEFYFNLMPDEWQNHRGKFLYAFDFSLLPARILAGGIVVCSLAGMTGMFYYAFRSYKLVQPTARLLSSRTISLQQQFTRNLIAQTASLTVILMISVLSFGSFTRINDTADKVGILPLPLLWVPFSNAFWTLTFMPDYRPRLFWVKAAQTTTNSNSVPRPQTVVVHQPVSRFNKKENDSL